MKVLRGKPVFDAIDGWCDAQISKLSENGFVPTLGIIRVGQREDDISYERSLLRKCDKIGLNYIVFQMDKRISNEAFLEEVKAINNDDSVSGILMFRPLPDHIDYDAVLKCFKPEKDIDGMLPENLGLVLAGQNKGYAPCTAEAVVEILNFYDVPVEGAEVSIINHSNVVGKPLAMMLTNSGATTTICHHHTRNLSDVVKSKNIVVSAIGKPKFFGADFFGEDQVIIDVGINVDDEGKLCGDVDYEEVIGQSAGTTPVPGGVGGVTTSLLLRNVVKACMISNKMSDVS